MKPGRYLILSLAAALACAPRAVSEPVAGPPPEPEPAPPADVVPQSWVDATLEDMPLRRKVGQMLYPRVPVDYLPAGGEAYTRMRRWVADLGIGGVVIHGGGIPFEVAARMNTLQALARVPLLVTADMEPGPLQNPSATRFPPLMGVGATGDPALGYQVGRITALEARAQGVHASFAPVVDVNNNPANPIINTRSYGEDPEAVAAFAAQHVRGLQDHGALATAKHFPGHGNTATDSHIELPVVTVDKAMADSVELVPYRAVIDANVAAIMTAHIAFPALTGDSIPATLNPRLTTDLLRGELGFDGIVFTDAMDMGAIVRRYGSGRAAVLAVKAGADALLQPMPNDVGVMIDAVVAAVESGEISEDRIDASVRRLLAAKAHLGLHRRRMVDLNRIPETVMMPAHTDVARDIAARSITAAIDRDRLLPLDTTRFPRALSIVYTDEGSAIRTGILQQELASRWPRLVQVTLDAGARQATLDSLLQRADSADVVLFSPYGRARHAKGSVAIAPRVAAFVQSLAQRRPTVVTSFGSPYVLAQFPAVGTYVLAWGGEDVSQRAAARALMGEAPITGRMPVSVPPLLPIGAGIDVRTRGN